MAESTPSTPAPEAMLTTNNAAADPAAADPAAADPAAANPAAADPAAANPAAADPADEVVSESYADFELPEGVVLDQALLDQATPMFKELGLTQSQAQKLVSFQAQIRQQEAEAIASSQTESYNTLITDWQNKSRADKEFGGEKFNENLAIANRAVSQYGTPAFAKLISDHGVGNHPEMIRFMLKIGRTLKEDAPSSSGNATSTAQSRISMLYPSETN